VIWIPEVTQGEIMSYILDKNFSKLLHYNLIIIVTQQLATKEQDVKSNQLRNRNG